MERIKTIYKEYASAGLSDVKNPIVKGLNILSKYTEEVQIQPAHDQIFAGLKDELYENMSDEDIHEMFKLGWMIDEESFAIFT